QGRRQEVADGGGHPLLPREPARDHARPGERMAMRPRPQPRRRHLGRLTVALPRLAGAVGHGRLVALAVIEPIAYVGDRKLVSGSQPAYLHALAIDPDAVGTPQVADDHLAM